MHTKTLIVGNWKMNPGRLADAKKIYAAISQSAAQYKNVALVICPPALYIPSLGKAPGIALGAQDCFWEPEGAHTGEVSAAMLANAGVRHVIVGHSERRALGETNERVAKKVKAALKAGLMPIICVGESVRDDKGEYHAIVKAQIIESLALVQKSDLKNITIAYEPVWAIGKSAPRAATPEEALEMNIFIRKVLADRYGRGAATVRLIYGASVDPKNASGFLAHGYTGLLPGRDSLVPEKLLAILASANAIKK